MGELNDIPGNVEVNTKPEADAAYISKVDNQHVSASSVNSTNSLVFVPVPGMSFTTKDLGEDGGYEWNFTAQVTHDTSNAMISVILEVGGVQITDSLRELVKPAVQEGPIITSHGSNNDTPSGTLVRVLWKTDTGNATIKGRHLHGVGHGASHIL